MCNFTPVQIIADYILRFLKNNTDAKLYEAMQRLEKKIGQFVADGVDEHQLRSSLSAKSVDLVRAALKEECEQLIP
jgi:hypothetical protein